jgi:bifunctional non-homologous end joining protein LigD
LTPRRLNAGEFRFISRRGYGYRAWPELAREVSKRVRYRSAVLDGELCCLKPDGRCEFYTLMFRRDRPFFMTFDLLWLDGRDLRQRSLSYRKQLVSRILPRSFASRVRYVEYIAERGVDLFNVACEYDLEGIVAKWAGGSSNPALERHG